MSDAENQMLAMLVVRDARIKDLEVENESLRNWIDEKRGFVDVPHPINCNAVLGVGECDCFTEEFTRHGIGVRGECEYEALEALIADLRACLKQILPTMNPKYQGETMRRISSLLGSQAQRVSKP